MSKVSVIIPAYNVEKSISEAMDSVLNQTYEDLEVIVVDDGSTDGTKDMLKKYIGSPRHQVTKSPVDVRYFYQQNKGPAAARNRGIKEAKGDYIAFLDSDDIWLPEKIEKQMQKIKEEPQYYLVHTARLRMEPDGSIKSSKRKVHEGSVLDELLKENFICCSSVLARRLCFDTVGLFDESRSNKSEDYDMWLRIAQGHKIGFVNEELVKYRVNPNGYNRSNIRDAYVSEKNVFLKALIDYKGNNKEKLRQEKLHKITYRMGHSFFYIKEYYKASLAFWEAVKIKKSNFKSIAWYIISKIKMGLEKGGL